MPPGRANGETIAEGHLGAQHMNQTQTKNGPRPPRARSAMGDLAPHGALHSGQKETQIGGLSEAGTAQESVAQNAKHWTTHYAGAGQHGAD
jgi:hypothetical protein